MMKALLVIPLLLYSFTALSASSGDTVIDGYVTSFDKKTIRLESGNRIVEIDRSKLKDKVKVGQRIWVSMTDAEFQQALEKSKALKAKK